jgi:hypothetical protein
MFKIKYIFLFLFILGLFSRVESFSLPENKILYDTSNDYLIFFANDNTDTIVYRKINKNIPTIAFHIKAKDNLHFIPVENIIIKDSAKDEVIQVIDPDKDSLEIVGIEFDDFNFDGYKDLYIHDGCAISANCHGKVFLYNKKLKKFVHHSGFDAMTSILADCEKKVIRSCNQQHAGADSDTKIYMFYGKKLSLIKEIYKTYDIKNSLYTYIINNYNKKGKLIKSKKIISERYDLE